MRMAAATAAPAVVSTPHAMRSATRRRCALRRASEGVSAAPLPSNWRASAAPRASAPAARERDVGQRRQRRVGRRGFRAPEATRRQRECIVVVARRAGRIGLHAAPVRRRKRHSALGRQRRDGRLGGHHARQARRRAAMTMSQQKNHAARHTAPHSAAQDGAPDAAAKSAGPERRRRGGGCRRRGRTNGRPAPLAATPRPPLLLPSSPTSSQMAKKVAVDYSVRAAMGCNCARARAAAAAAMHHRF